MAMGFMGTGSTPNYYAKDGGSSELEFGLKQSKPLNLMVARSPLFSVPPGLSPSGLLNSPGFYGPQVKLNQFDYCRAFAFAFNVLGVCFLGFFDVEIWF